MNLFILDTYYEGRGFKMKVWKIEYFHCGDLVKSVVLAKTMTEAISLIVDGDSVKEQDVIKCEEKSEKGVVLTWYQD